jgi:hypothetical protein
MHGTNPYVYRHLCGITAILEADTLTIILIGAPIDV